MIPRGDAAPREPQLSRADRRKVGLALLVLPWLVRLLKWTYRIEVVEGAERAESMVRDRQPVVLAGWHESLLLSGSFLLDRFVARRFPLVMLVSHSRDGEILARVVHGLGIGTVRGSTSRGGLSGLRRLYKTLTKERRSVGLAPDGPRGPAKRCQPGALLLAQVAGVELVPLAGAADRAWRLGSWDRMFVPKPFARLAIAVGEPVRVAPGLGSEELEAEGERLAETLDKLSDRAARALQR